METRSERKVKQGLVVSDKMDKTVVVSVEHVRRHPVYERVVRRNRKVKAHDERNECRAGDLVQIMETRPLSKQKRWRVLRVLEKARN